jgi:hypothetical protein
MSTNLIMKSNELEFVDHASSKDDDEAALVAFETTLESQCEATVGHTMMARGRDIHLCPVQGTGAIPPTPMNQYMQLRACDKAIGFDRLSGDDLDNASDVLGTGMCIMKSCSPSVSVNPPAFYSRIKTNERFQRRTWGVPMV